MTTTKELMIALEGNKQISYRAAYTKITGSLTRGVLLSQLMYWGGKMKYEEFYKEDAEILEETALSPKELKNAKARLIELGFINVERKTKRRISHYTIELDAIVKALVELSKGEAKTKVTTGQKGNSLQAKRDRSDSPKGTVAYIQQNTTIEYVQKNETPPLKIETVNEVETPTPHQLTGTPMDDMIASQVKAEFTRINTPYYQLWIDKVPREDFENLFVKAFTALQSKNSSRPITKNALTAFVTTEITSWLKKNTPRVEIIVSPEVMQKEEQKSIKQRERMFEIHEKEGIPLQKASKIAATERFMYASLENGNMPKAKHWINQLMNLREITLIELIEEYNVNLA